MWRAKIEVTLEDDRQPEASESFRFEITEALPSGLESLDHWEEDVRRVGFRCMRKLFALGINRLEEEVLSSYTHLDGSCDLVKCGRLSFGIGTVFGKVQFQRQRLYCRSCQAWITPVNDALRLHETDQCRSTLGLKDLVCLCVSHQPYRLAHKMVAQITQDPHVLSQTQMHRIVATTGEDIRAVEEKKSKQTSLSVIRNIQDRQIEDPQEGTLYICLDGVMVRSNEGKGRWREGKVGFVCTDEREAIGRKGKQSIPDKRYISSFESADVFGSLVYGEAICMGMRAYKQIILLGDGARWIRALHRQCFRQARYVLDWYHLDDKIYQTLKRTLPEDPALRKSLCKRVTHYFWIGRKDDALSLLEDLRADLIKGGLQAVVHQSEGLQVLGDDEEKCKILVTRL